MTGVLIKRLPRGDSHTLGKHYVTTLARIGVMQLQAKEHQKLLVNPQILAIYKEVSLHMSEGARPCYNLEFGLLASRIIKPYLSVVFNRLLQSLVIRIAAYPRFKIHLGAYFHMLGENHQLGEKV